MSGTLARSFHDSFHEPGRGEGKRSKAAGHTRCPRQDSNLRHLFRREVLYPLSYGGAAPSVANARATPTDTGSSAESPVIPEIADRRRGDRPILASSRRSELRLERVCDGGQ